VTPGESSRTGPDVALRGGQADGQADGKAGATVDATADGSSDGRSPGRQPLDQLRILSEAVAFIDQSGLDHLTMRRLGAHLGVEAMALYRYVPGREQLLDGVVEVVMDELYHDTMEMLPPQNWPEYLQQMAHGVRRLALNHPRIFPLVATRPPAAPWLRPPLRSLRWVEGFLEALRNYGFSPVGSVAVYRGFATFLLGHLLLESSLGGPESDLPASADIAFIETNDLSAYPLVTEYAVMLGEDAFVDEFEDALEDLINRMAPLHD
jgi:AcrR family transcriptional regulator